MSPLPADTPPIIERKVWLPTPYTFGHAMPPGPAGEWLAHHTIVPDLSARATLEDEARAMLNVHRYHERQKYGGFSYQWAIFDSGRIWEGRGWGRTGAHTKGRNSKSIGFVFFINGDKRSPSAKAWKAAQWLIAVGEVSGNVARGASLGGHRRYAKKSCPGAVVTDEQLRYTRVAVDNAYRR